MTSFYITPLLHPMVVRADNWAKEPAQQTYLKRIVRTEKDGLEPKDWRVADAPDGSYLYPSLAQLDKWWENFQREGYNAISHDLETAGQFIICDGLTPLDTRDGRVGPSLCLRFRGHGGVQWWNTFAKHSLAVDWFGRVLSDPLVSFVGHNVVGFDIPILKAHGFKINGPIIDTMVMQSRAYPEMQKGLQYCATLYLWAPAWKRSIKEDIGKE